MCGWVWVSQGGEVYGVVVADELVRYAYQHFLFRPSQFRLICLIAQRSWDLTLEQKHPKYNQLMPDWVWAVCTKCSNQSIA